HGGYKPTDK
uniref:Orpotrin n=1 Tax=Potamotrygon orbignyi TaxID=86381 RepID=ORPO_POTOR|nr:RecName: Full=Orpotrin [Potamotrygon orbignyi]